jgi:ribose transport system substrate-binding protein
MFRKIVGSLLVLGAIVLAAKPAVAQNKGIDDPFRLPVYESLKGKRVVYIPLAMGIDLTEGWYHAMKKQAGELGYEIQVLDPNWNTEAGIRALNSAISSKADLIVLHNPDIQSYAKLVQKAQQNGIKVVEVGMQSLGGADAAIVGDYVRGGEQAANEIVKHCGKGSNGPSNKVVMVLGPPTAAASVYPQKGFWNVMEQHPEINVVSQQVGDYDPVKTRSIMSTILQQHPDLCGYFGMWDNSDVGAGAAVVEAGKQGQVFIVSLSSGGRATCENIKKGLITEALAYNIPLEGAALNATIAGLLESHAAAGATKSVDFISATALNKDNAEGVLQCWAPEDLDPLF